MPTMPQAGVYTATLHYLRAIQAAGTDDADKVAAQMLLQAYLDAGCPADPTAGPLDA